LVFKKTIQNLSILGTGQIVVIISNVVFYFVFAQILGPEKYGNLAFLISIAIIVPTFARFGFSQTIITFIAKKEHDLEKTSNLIAFITSIIVSLFLLFIDPFVAILSFSFSSFMMCIGILLGHRKYKIVSLYTVGRSVVWLVASLSLYFVMGIPGILLGMTIGHLVFSFRYFQSISFTSPNFSKLKNKFKFIIQNFSVDISQIIPNQIDKLIVVPLFGFQTAGIFHFAIQFLIAIELLTIVLHRFFLAEQSKDKIPKKIILYLSLLSAGIIFIGIFLSPYVIQYLFPDYLESILAVQIIIVGILPLIIISILNAKLQVLESNLVGFGVLIRIGSNVALLPILGGLLGIPGLALSNLISLILLSLYLIIIYNKTENSGNLSRIRLS